MSAMTFLASALLIRHQHKSCELPGWMKEEEEAEQKVNEKSHYDFIDISWAAPEVEGCAGHR